MENFASAPLRSAAPSHHTHQGAAAEPCGRRPFWLSPSGCFVSPCHTTAAFDFIIAVAGQAVKQTTGRKAEAPPPPRSCSPVHELVTAEVSGSPSIHDRAAASRYTPPRIHLDALVNIYVPWVRVDPAEKIKILPLEEI